MHWQKFHAATKRSSIAYILDKGTSSGRSFFKVKQQKKEHIRVSREDDQAINGFSNTYEHLNNKNKNKLLVSPTIIIEQVGGDPTKAESENKNKKTNNREKKSLNRRRSLSFDAINFLGKKSTKVLKDDQVKYLSKNKLDCKFLGCSINYFCLKNHFTK